MKKYLTVSTWFFLLTLPFLGVFPASILSLFIMAGYLSSSLIMQVWDMARKLADKPSAEFRRSLSGKWNGISEIKLLSALMPVMLLLPLFLDRYSMDISIMALTYVVLALGLNIVVGMAGLLALGYIAFYAVGAYTFALLSTHYQISFWIAVPIAAAISGLFGILLGIPTLRLRGDYLAVTTLGFGEIMRIVLNNWNELTGGPNGIMGIGRPEFIGYTFNRPEAYYYLILAIASATIVFVRRLDNSRIGRAWVAIREDEIAAEAMGINTTFMKLIAFSLAASIAGIAGTFYAAKMTFISPESFNFMESIIVLCMVVLGGSGSIPGVILGAVLLTVLPESLRGVQEYRMLVFGAAMVLVMIFRPQGLLGSFSRNKRAPDERLREHEMETLYDAKLGDRLE